MSATDLALAALPAGPVPPCSWFVDLPCNARAVIMIMSDNHRAGACDRCMRLALARALEVNER